MPHYIEAKSILNKSKKRDSWFLSDYTVNPYSACSFNCLYCYIRGSKYGEHMQDKLTIKTNAVELLDKQLFNRAKKGQFGYIVLASATDPYLHFEEKEKLTRGMLEVIRKHRFPVHMITKSDGIRRDFDLLHEINSSALLPDDLKLKGLPGVLMSYSFSTLDSKVAKIFEPGAQSPSTRLTIVKESVEANFHTGISLMPLLPYISDTSDQLTLYFEKFKELGVNYILPAGTTLFGHGKSDSRTLVFRAIAKHYPDLLAIYQKLYANSSELPAYYRNAFHQKMLQMSMDYKLPIKILP